MKQNASDQSNDTHYCHRIQTINNTYINNRTYINNSNAYINKNNTYINKTTTTTATTAAATTATTATTTTNSLKNKFLLVSRVKQSRAAVY